MERTGYWTKFRNLLSLCSRAKIQNMLMQMNDKELAIIFRKGDGIINGIITGSLNEQKMERVKDELKVLRHQYVSRQTEDFILIRTIAVLEGREEYKKGATYIVPAEKKKQGK